MSPEEREAFAVDTLARIALALESINRNIFLIRDMIAEARGEATDEEG